MLKNVNWRDVMETCFSYAGRAVPGAWGSLILRIDLSNARRWKGAHTRHARAGAMPFSDGICGWTCCYFFSGEVAGDDVAADVAQGFPSHIAAMLPLPSVIV